MPSNVNELPDPHTAYRRRIEDVVEEFGTISVGIVCGLVMGGPVLLGVISMLRERFTGNTAPNTSLSREGEVVPVAPGRVDVRLSDGKVESFRFGQDTTFVFLGPGSPLVKGEAGPSWLTLGQKIGVSYV